MKIDYYTVVPPYVQKAMSILANAEGTPYLVGGAVRDIFLQKTPHDYDLATSLTPTETIVVLSEHNIPVVEKLGNNFGVVTGIFDGEPIEIATFRKERYGADDPHRPEEVIFSQSIEEDLSRRDFTINAMAIDNKGNLIDPYHGAEDIKRKVLRTVGNPSDRYHEDPLRMYRACRFISQLGFIYCEKDIPSNVFIQKDFWKECKAQHLSMERVRQEIEKLLVGNYPDKGLELLMTSGLIHAPFTVREKTQTLQIAPLDALSHLYELPQNPQYHNYDAWHHTTYAVKTIPNKLHLRWSALLHDAGKGHPDIRYINPKTNQPSDYGHEKMSTCIAGNILIAFGYNKKQIKIVQYIVQHHMDMLPLMHASMHTTMHWIRKQIPRFRTQQDMLSAFSNLKEMFFADLTASRNNEEDKKTIVQQMNTIQEIVVRQMPIHTSELKIESKHIKETAKITGLPIPNIYHDLLKKVQDGQITNTKEALMDTLRRKEKRYINNTIER